MGNDRMSRKILYVSGSRADYGLMRSVLFQISKRPGMELHIAATGMHLLPEFGNTLSEIQNDGFSGHIVNASQVRDTKESMAAFVGLFITEFTHLVQTLRPDIILLLGDRGEMLGAAIVGAYLGIPIAHIHGGEITSTPDEIARHAITKLSHIHLAATVKSAARIRKMGENPRNVYVVGAPGLDQVIEILNNPSNDVAERYNIAHSVPLILVIQHPVPLEPGDPAAQIEETLRAVSQIPCQALVIYPNADTGGRRMIDVIKKYETLKNIRAYPSVSHSDFLNIMKLSSVIVGNSSSALIEAPSLGIPAINIGSRQNGREQGENVINTVYESVEITAAINRALSDSTFLRKVKRAKNPYGNGNSSKMITDVLERIEITPDLLQKRMIY